ncbi:uncharacterized protein RCC_04304 [Ramularia collo-cygni]|uniref:Uncharacterized protein n=1 Tax=Ramularia collo-cygni TaxID=112498 RepID=A0A2D3VA98_9PEZI|nr:uncharacterized protein RCC_04304 [Ramularia collo-cygni]CZT18459.1 uncharacterized protein RCC_04304 [Ramularia collo-cygni]
MCHTRHRMLCRCRIRLWSCSTSCTSCHCGLQCSVRYLPGSLLGGSRCSYSMIECDKGKYIHNWKLKGNFEVRGTEGQP